LIQPHGIGCLQYPDGTAFTCEWSNGSPLGNYCYYQADSEPVSPRESLPILGYVARPEDMQAETEPQRAQEHVSSLEVHSFAFVLRSNGEWTYAIVSDRQSGPDASIRFVLDTKGSTKIIKAKHWSRYIRLVKNVDTDEPVQNAVDTKEDSERQTKNSVKRSRSSDELARLASFRRAVRRVSIDMTAKKVS
jgi:hypothetical protein